MGRKKIQISRITDERNRQVTFNKRKFGVMKKAYELSVLCDCEIALIIFSSSNKLYQYASTDMDKVLLKYTEYSEPHESLTNKNIIEKENKNGIMSPDSPEQETDYTLTPRTEAKYNKIDEEFQTMMRNQMAGGGVVTARNMTNPNYTLPVSVPVAGSYGDAMLQASPQMSHTNISPRPSSSETDSVYPSGSMLEMSNGYPHSHSPLGGTPSPGPSPGIAHHLSHKQESPGNQNGRASHLRVVIPTTGVAQNMSTTDDIGYSDRHGQSLNTPVVTLQTPIPGLAGYSTFGPQDFSMSSSDVIGLPTWTTHQGLVSHAGLPHLTVSNSVSPPATSPVSIKVKSEPQSPPRDLSGSGGGGGGNNNNGGLTNHQQNSNGSNGSSNGHISTSNALTISGMNNAVAAAAVIAGGVGGGGGGGGGNSGGGTILGGASLTGEQAANLSVLNHPQQHLVMAGSRPSSTGHITPTPVIDKYEGYPYRSQLGPNPRYWNFAGATGGGGGGGGGGGSNGANTPTNLPSPTTHQQQQMTDYDGPNQPLKRPRISGGWAT